MRYQHVDNMQNKCFHTPAEVAVNMLWETNTSIAVIKLEALHGVQHLHTFLNRVKAVESARLAISMLGQAYSIRRPMDLYRQARHIML